MLYFYKILDILRREMDLCLVGKFFICCGALGLGLGLALGGVHFTYLKGGNKDSQIWMSARPFIELLQSAEFESEEE